MKFNYLQKALTGCACLILIMAQSRAQQTQTMSFTTPGTYTFTVPPLINSLTVQLWGGGGGGGFGFPSYRFGAGGGGSGGYTYSTFPVTPGTTYSLTVGDGGWGGSNALITLVYNEGYDGNSGEASSFGNSLAAPGGGGGGGNKMVFNPLGWMPGQSWYYNFWGSGGSSSTPGGAGESGNVNLITGSVGSGDPQSITGQAGGFAGGRGGNAGNVLPSEGSGGSGAGLFSAAGNGVAPGGGGGGGSCGAVNFSGNAPNVAIGGKGANGRVKVTWQCPVYTFDQPPFIVAAVCVYGQFEVSVHSSNMPAGTYLVHYYLDNDTSFLINAFLNFNGTTGTFHGNLSNFTGTSRQLTIKHIQWVPPSFNLNEATCGNDLTSFNTTIINVINLSPPVITGPVTIAFPGSVTLTAAAGYSSYQWSNGATTPSINVEHTGNYSVTITDINGCVATASRAVTITGAPTTRLWSMTPYGGTNNNYGTPGHHGDGVIFSINLDGTGYTKQYEFDSLNGQRPNGGLIEANDQYYYGLTSEGGANNAGVLFRFDPFTRTYTKLFDFDGIHGSSPQGDLVQADNGLIYGMTNTGGTTNQGVVFRWDPVNGMMTKILDFNGANGANPFGALMQASDGKLYGMTNQGGASNSGVLFRIDPAGNVYTKLHDFDFPSGRHPYGGLIQADNGLLYGLTHDGGSGGYLGYGADQGVLFSYDITTNILTPRLTTLLGHPFGTLAQATDGKLYSINFGYDPTGDSLTHFASNNTNGFIYLMGEYGSIMQASNGKWYGMPNSSSNYDNYGAELVHGGISTYDPANSIQYIKIFNGIDGAWPQYASLLEIVNYDINTGTVPVSVCTGDPFYVPFTVASELNAGNIFSAELSDANGSFASPVTIGTVAGAHSGAVPALIPGTIPSGANYRIRIISSSPGSISVNSSNPFTVNNFQPSVTGDSVGCGSVSLTATGGTGYWWSNGNTTSATGNFSHSGIYNVMITDANGCSRKLLRNVTVNPVPAVVIGGIPVACDSVRLFASGATSYTWSGGLTPFSASNIFAVQGSVGQFTAYVTGTDSNGCSATASQDFTLYGIPAAHIVPHGDSVICYGQFLTLDAGYFGFQSGSQFTWTNHTGDTLQQGASKTISVNRTGIYKVLVTNASGCYNSDEQIVVVDSLRAPLIVAGSSAPYCASGVPVTLSGEDTLYSGYSWYTDTVIRNYYLTAADLANCDITCPGGGIRFGNNGNSALTWVDSGSVNGVVSDVNIRFQLGIICNTAITHTAALNGIPAKKPLYSVLYGCSCVIPGADFNTFSVDFPAASYQAGQQNTVTIPSVPAGTSLGFAPDSNGYFGVVTVTYRRFKGTGNLSFTPQLTVTPDIIPSQYFLEVRDSFGCTARSSITLHTTEPDNNILASDSLVSCADSVQVIANPGFSDFVWNTGATTDPVYVRNTGWYYVSARDANGCIGHDKLFVANMRPRISLPDTTVCAGTALTLSAGGGDNFAVRFDGLSQYIDPDLLPLVNDNFSVEFIAKPESSIQLPPESNTGVFSQQSRFLLWPTHAGSGQDISLNAGMGVSFGQNGIAIVEHGGSYLAAPLVYAGNFNDYTHVTVVYENKQPRLYINGVLVRTGLQSLRDTVWVSLGHGNTYGTQQGGIGGGTYGYFEGLIDNFKVWSYALDSADVQAHYQDRHVTGAYADYELNEGHGNITYSSGIPAFPATFINHPSWAANDHFNNFNWSTGDTTAVITVIPQQASVYHITISDGFHSCSNSIHIAMPTEICGNGIDDDCNGLTDEGCPITLYVDSAATGAGNGTSWANAYTSFADAVVAAHGNFLMDTILVAKGTYYPQYIADSGSTDRDKAFIFTRSGLAVLGGYPSGGGTRNPAAYPVILSGDIGATGVSSDNAYHVLVTVSTNATLVLDGFTVTGGNANGAGSITVNGQDISGNSGGGMYNSFSSPSNANCVFSGNSAGNIGGGIYNYASGPVLTHCIVSGNSADINGGGVFNDNASNPVLTGVTISGNNAVNDGGGGMYNSSSSPILANCILWNNSADGVTNTASASIFNSSSTPSISYSLIANSGGSNWITAIGTDGGNNIDADPMFVMPVDPATAPVTAGNLRLLLPCSPAINAGNNGSFSPGITTDLDGNPRLFSGAADMGAYEYQGNPVAGVLYVDASATGGVAAGGTSWADAFTALADAVKLAHDCPGVDTILVAQGTYYPQYMAGDGSTDRDKAFIFTRSGLAVLGGYPTGGGTRNPVAYPVILSGDIGTPGVNTDNTCHVIITTGTNATLVLDGFTITGGNADVFSNITVNEQTIPGNSGGGIYNRNSSPSIANCVFSGNSAGFTGGGMYNTNSSSPGIADCVFSGNSASYGGGMYNNNSSTPNITNCVLSGNSASHGGGMYNNNSSSPGITNCMFLVNSAGIFGGGMANIEFSSPSLTNCVFSGNSATDGGGIYNSLSSSTLTNCIIWNNRAGGVTTTASASIFNSSFLTSSISYSLIANSGGSTAWVTAIGTNGGNNIDSDPLFVTPVNPTAAPLTASNLHLMPCSPAINAGNNTAIPSGISTDLDGNTRVINGIVDMGVYEYRGSGNVLYVDASATGGADNGDSWANAFTSLAGAIKLAHDCPGVDSILVAHGTYYPEYAADGVSTNNRDKSFTFTRGGLAVLGGYPARGGTRNPAAYPVILSGDIGTPGVNTDNTYHVIVTAGATVDNTLVFDGITITAGNAVDGSFSAVMVNGFEIYRYHGGGCFNAAASPRLSHVIITENAAFRGGGIQNRDNSSPVLTNVTINGNTATNSGGGMYNYASSSPVLTNCMVSGNSASVNGGGVLNDNASNPALTDVTMSENSAVNGGGMCNFSSSPILANCSFSGNSANGNGGGILNSFSSPTITNCSFSGNSTNGNGGGVINANSSSPTLTNCSFSGNSAGFDGGGMSNNSSSPGLAYCSFSGNSAVSGGGMTNTNSSSPGIANCVFSGNSASYGGGIYNSSSSPGLNYCSFSGNSAPFGSGIYNNSSSPDLNYCSFSGNSAGYNGGGMYNFSSSPTLANCSFSGNSALSGGGVYNSSFSSPGLTNCSFSGNSTNGPGGGMYNDGSSPVLANCVFSGNSANGHGGGMYSSSSSPTLANCIIWNNRAVGVTNTVSASIFNSSSTPSISYSLIANSGGSGSWVTGIGTDGGNNIDADPLFVTPVDPVTAPATAGNLQLLAGSPAINAGNNAAVPSGITTDLGGNPRIYNGTVDMGAYEHQPVSVTWYLDADNDGWYVSTQTGVTSPGAGWINVLPSGGNGDCDDNNALIHEPQQYYVDADQDGYGSTTTAMLCSTTAPAGYSINNTDCDDNPATDGAGIHEPQQYYIDADQDGYGSTTTAMLCSTTATAGYSINNTDCDDNPATDGAGIHEPQQYYIDADQDGYGSTTTAMLCSTTAPAGYSINNTDCDDNPATDGAGIHEPQQYYIDADQDGYGSTTTAMLCSITAPTGYSTNNTDCDDNPATGGAGIHEPQQYFVDADQDGYGSVTTAMLCSTTAPTGYSTNNTDCDDNPATGGAGIHEPQQYYVDADQDGYGSTITAMLCSTTAPAGYSTNNTDCNDADMNIHTPPVCQNGGTVNAGCGCDCPPGYTGTFCETPVCIIPNITCPANISVNNDAGTCGAIVNYAVATATGTAPVITYSQNPGTLFPVGTTTVLVIATNNCGADTCSFEVTVTDNEPPAITCPGNLAINTDAGSCMATNVSLGTPVTNDNCGVLSVTNNHPSTTYPIGNTTVTWTVTDIHANTAICTQVVTVTNANLVSVSISAAATTICNGTVTGFTATAVNGGTSPSYQWKVNGANKGTNSPNFTPATLANGNVVTCVLTSNITCPSGSLIATGNPIQMSLVGAPAKPGAITQTSGNLKICPGDTASYEISPVLNTINYSWTAPPGATILSGQNTTGVTLAFNTGFSANGSLTVTAGNNCGYSQIQSKTITRNTAPVLGAITGANTVPCIATGIPYNVNPIENAVFNWYFNNATAVVTSGNGTNSISAAFNGFTSASLYVSATTGCGTSALKNIAIKYIPENAGAISGPATVCSSAANVEYSIPPLPNVTSYTWTTTNGAVISDGINTQSGSLITSSTNVTIGFGTKQVVVKVKSNDCSTGAVSQLTVTVTKCGRSSIPMEVPENNSISLFPNPAKDIVNVVFQAVRESRYEIRVYDALGKEVLQQTGDARENSNQVELDVSNLTAGVYQMLLESENSHYRARFIVE